MTNDGIICFKYKPSYLATEVLMAANEPSPSALFANVRSKLSNFHAADLLPTFSFLKKKAKATTLKPNWSRNDAIDVSKTLSTPVKSHPIPVRQTYLAEDAARNGTVLELSVVSSDSADSDQREQNSRLIRPDLIGVFADTLSKEATNYAIHSICTHSLNAFCNNDDHALIGAAENFNCDTLEFQHFGTLRGLKTLGKRAPAIGHEFEIAQLVNPSFCDKCGDFIWGLYKQAVRCQNCNYTCHYKCQPLVTLDCRSLSDSNFLVEDTDLNRRNKNETILEDSAEVSGTNTIPERVVETADDEMASLKLLVDQYNHHMENLKITFDDNGKTFHGFIQISINLARPISIVAGEKPSSIYDVLNPDSTLKNDTATSSAMILVDPYAPKTITSFFLPRNSMKILHIGSETTTRHMIAALLKKFKVADNPFKFALYERDTESGETLKTRLRRFPDDGYPLRTLLSWGYQTNKRFVLQENDTGDILWDYFEAPELENFLIILDKEEKQYISDIKKRYNEYRFNIQHELHDRGNPVSYVERDDDETTRQFT